jgi:hypothetical protein
LVACQEEVFARRSIRARRRMTTNFRLWNNSKEGRSSWICK